MFESIKRAFKKWVKAQKELDLLELAEQGKTQELLHLIRSGEKIETKTKNGNTLLGIAILYDQTETALALIKLGAEIGVRDEWHKDRPIHTAADRGNNTIVKELLSRGEIVDCVNKWGMTPLHRASWAGQTETCKLLLEAGANIKHADRKGKTPLHHAARENRSETTLFLLKNGADINAKCHEDITPLHECVLHLAQETTKVLVENGAEVTTAINSSLQKRYNGYHPIYLGEESVKRAQKQNISIQKIVEIIEKYSRK